MPRRQGGKLDPPATEEIAAGMGNATIAATCLCTSSAAIAGNRSAQPLSESIEDGRRIVLGGGEDAHPRHFSRLLC
jgi:hypothetical protein